MTDADIYLAISVGAGTLMRPKPVRQTVTSGLGVSATVEGDSLLFDDGERREVMTWDAYQTTVAGIAGYVALGHLEDALIALERVAQGIVRDEIVTAVFQTFAIGEVWSAEIPVVDVMRARSREFLVAIRDRRLLERPRVVLAPDDSTASPAHGG